MRAFSVSVVAVLASFACDAPDFVECDGGTIVEVDGVPTCVLPDAGTDAGTPRDDAAGPTLDSGPGDGGRDAGGFDAGLGDAGRDGGQVDAAGHDATTDGGAAPGFDAPDCLDDFECVFDARSVLDLSAATERMVVEQIDAADHVIPLGCGLRTGPDRDVFRIRAPVRAILEIEVAAVGGGALTPVVEVFDEASPGYIAVFDSPSGSASRVVAIAPAPPPEGLLVRVQHAAAYTNLCSGGDPGFRGGSAYGYTLTARLCTGCAIQELGALGTGRTATANQSSRGDMTVYRFTAAEDATPTVSVSLAGSCPAALGGACCPVVVPLLPGGVTPPTQRANYTSTLGRTCSGDTQGFPMTSGTNASGERLFAVYDYESAGAPGYAIDVSVTP